MVLRDDTHVTFMKIVQFSRLPTRLSLVHRRSKIFHWPWTSNSKQTLSSPNDNQSIKRKHNPSINSLILSGFLLTSFHLVKASLSAFLWLSAIVCAVSQKYNEMSFISNYSHF